MHAGPRCEHCAYSLTGIAVTDFIARCPECGRDSDIRRVPPPNIPWWHTPAAIGVGMLVTYGGVFACALAERWGIINVGGTNRAMGRLGFVFVAVGATLAVALLAKDYRERWAFKYGRGKAPPRAWGLLLLDWAVAAIVIGALPGVVFIALSVLFGM